MSHGLDGRRESFRIGHRQRARFADADIGPRAMRLRDLVAGGMRRREHVRRLALDHDAIKRRAAPRDGKKSMRLCPLPRDDNLRDAQSQIDRIEKRYMHIGVLDHKRRDRRDQFVGFFTPGVVAGQYRKADQILGRNGVVVRRCFIGGRRGPRRASRGDH